MGEPSLALGGIIANPGLVPHSDDQLKKYDQNRATVLVVLIRYNKFRKLKKA